MKSVVLLSGGLDSTTCLAIAHRDGTTPYALTVDYGQRHRQELDACAKVADPDAADAYMSVRSYRNGSGHVKFKRPDLVDRMNLIVAKHFPGCLPAPK